MTQLSRLFAQRGLAHSVTLACALGTAVGMAVALPGQALAQAGSAKNLPAQNLSAQRVPEQPPQGFVIKDIQVEGLRRTEAGTVFSYLPVRVGDTFNDEKAAQSIRALFATGFFDDVKIGTKDDILLITVTERPAIASVEINGAKEFPQDTLKNALKGIGIGESKIFDRSLLDKAEQELKRQYLSRSRYGAQVQTKVQPLDRNRVAVVFNIDEGEAAAIKEIKIIGAKDFKEKELLDQFELSKSSWTSWLTKNDQYNRQKLTGDLEKLRSFYLNRGYADFSIEGTQVQISPNKEDMFVTITIKGGDKFKFGDVDLSGELIGRDDELRSLMQVKKGDSFNGELLNESAKAIQDRLGNYGYAFANANVIPDLDRENKLVNVNVAVDTGKRVYVRRMNVGGNTRTKDEVIRREFRQFESATYDSRNIQLSKDRVDRLGYFSNINIDTQPVPGTSDQVDVNMQVEEKPTGNVLLGAGISSTDRLVLSAAIQQANLFGSGKTVGLEINTSRINRTVSFSHTDPYFTMDGVSRSFEVFNRRTDPSSLNLGDYIIETTGLGLRFGYPIGEFERISFGAGFENTKLEVGPTSPSRFRRYVDDFGSSTNAVLINASYGFDNRDSSLAPTRGRVRRLSAEYATPLGDQEFIKTTYQEQLYLPLSKKYTLALNGEITGGFGLGSSKYPIFRNVYAGGIGTVRGYRSSSLGPRDADNVPLGGSKRLVGNVEFFFPLPGVNKDRTFRAFTFLDAGNVFQSNERIRLGELRYSTGFGISWLSPVGPLKFSLGVPLNKEDQDELQKVQFTIGSGF